MDDAELETFGTDGPSHGLPMVTQPAPAAAKPPKPPTARDGAGAASTDHSSETSSTASKPDPFGISYK